MCAIIIVIIP